MQCRPPAFGAADRHACLDFTYGCRHPRCTQHGGAGCCGRTAHPAAGMCGWVPSPVPHTCLALSLHMTNAAHRRCRRQHTAALTDAAVRSWCDAVLGPSTAGLCTRGCAHRVRGRGPCIASGTALLWRWADSPRAVDRAPGLGSPPPHLRRDWAHPSHICAGTGPDSPSGRRVCAPARARARWRRTRLRARRRWERALDLLTAHNMHSITGRVL
jgi:hypothetical protein